MLDLTNTGVQILLTMIAIPVIALVVLPSGKIKV